MPNILIVAEHASSKFGGEAALPLHYFRVLRKRHAEVWLLVHDRTKTELSELFPDESGRVYYVPDTRWHRILWSLGRYLPGRLAYFTTGFLMRLLTQFVQRSLVKEIVRSKAIDVVHQPMPVSPKEPSSLFGLNVPVVIGPMNGGMNYPPAFSKMQGGFVVIALFIGRSFATILNFVLPGKRDAAILLVANSRTREALPGGVCRNVQELVENGVDLSVWRPKPDSSNLRTSSEPRATKFLFLGRLVDWKAVDILLEAFSFAKEISPMTLTIVGDGEERQGLEALCAHLSLTTEDGSATGSVSFLGWRPQEECAELLSQADALVLPSILECGGAVVLEAMALRKPVIATNWGGPADYLDVTCGILVNPTSRTEFIDGLARALVKLADDPVLRSALGDAGYRKVISEYDWEKKTDRMISIYEGAIEMHLNCCNLS